MKVKPTNQAIMLLPITEHMYGRGIFHGLYHPTLSLFPLLLLSFLPSITVSSVSGLEYDWGTQPKLVCIPIPADTDPSCFTPAGAAHGPSSNGHGNGHGPNSNGQGNGLNSNGHGNGHHGPVSGMPNSHTSSSSRHGISDEAKATILHLRESLVRQKETILDQRETIRELTAKLTLCESFGRGHHDDNHHGPSNHNSHHSSHHYDSHPADPHFPLNGHRNDHHRAKSPYLGTHGGFSTEQTGRTLQALKEKLENLQTRNSSSSYSSSLKDLLQRKINVLEELLHRHHDSHHNTGHQDSNHGHDDHRNNPHSNHHDDHHDTHHANHHEDHPPTHNYNHHHSYHNERRSDHHNDPHNNHQAGHDDDQDNHHNSHDDHHDDSHNGNGHHDDVHQSNGRHDDGHHGREDHSPQIPYKPTGSRAPVRGTHTKLETVLSNLHKTPEAGPSKKPKNPDAFQIGFPMRTNYMYGRIKRTLLNEIFALTVCLWLKGGSGPGIGTPFSYSVPGQANELVLIEWGNNPMELLVNDKAVTLPISLSDSKWHHLCVTWSTRDGTWEAYQDGVKRGSGENLSPWHSVKPGGVFILGQEQDTLGGRFDATQSFVGEMSDLQLWSRVLNSAEIYNQASCSSHLTGDVINWSESMVELHGGVTKYPFDPCH
ncbi:Neuronal pentraxin-2 [Triplophysa tibetana]|uniref:Neuronal pentraxin-2 n=1 Tax=Triplophysa tibetana TaxID=1572043 RepID=A0A5A9NMQ7_9TELE|nr:Neuronal pentraxin-2 [Triplophysa tibetana]